MIQRYNNINLKHLPKSTFHLKKNLIIHQLMNNFLLIIMKFNTFQYIFLDYMNMRPFLYARTFE